MVIELLSYNEQYDYNEQDYCDDILLLIPFVLHEEQKRKY